MNPQWYIIEGPDGAGKSWASRTLVGALAAHGGSAPERPCMLMKLSYDSKPVEYVEVPVNMRDNGHIHVVQDRGVLSGPVYEPLFRQDIARLNWMNPMVEHAARANALVIHVTASLEALSARLEERGDDYVAPSNLADILEGYAAIMARWEACGGKAVTLDTTDGFPERDEVEFLASALAAL